MAYMIDKTCTVCGRIFTAVDSARIISDSICHKCKNKEANALKIQHFEKLDKMPIEQRLRRLEKVAYNRSLIKNKIPYDPNAIYG